MNKIELVEKIIAYYERKGELSYNEKKKMRKVFLSKPLKHLESLAEIMNL